MDFHGELAYKDVHGRVWRMHAGLLYWHAATLDQGHTARYEKHDADFAMLLASIDREEFLTDDRAARPIQSGKAGSKESPARRESQPESIAEISKLASEANGHQSQIGDTTWRLEERGE